MRYFNIFNIYFIIYFVNSLNSQSCYHKYIVSLSARGKNVHSLNHQKLLMRYQLPHSPVTIISKERCARPTPNKNPGADPETGTETT